MKKLIINLFLFFFVLFFSLIIVLSTTGIETNKFNKIISDKASQTKNIFLKLNTINFKIDPRKLSLFLETKNPEITYREILIPVQNIKLYIDFFSIFKSEPKIKKTNLVLKELDITQLNKLSTMIKPSNFKSLINNKIKEGKLISEIDIFLDDKGSLENFIAKGEVNNLKAELSKNINFTNTKFSFFADKNDILIKNIFGKLEDIKISDGDIKLNLENGIKFTSNFNSKDYLNEKILNKYSKLLNKYDLADKIKILNINLNSNISINFDNTYKLKNYDYNISGKLEKLKLNLPKGVNYIIIPKQVKEIYFSDFQIKSIFTSDKINFNGNGKYSFDDKDFLNINLDSQFSKNILELKSNFDYSESFKLDLINYKKPKDVIANLSLNLKKDENNYNIELLNFNEGNNKIEINGLEFKKNKFSSFKKIEVKTKNNNFLIKNNKKILVSGKKFDATNLTKFLNSKKNENNLQNINSDIEIDFKNIKVPMSEKLQNFKLIGEIKEGKFVKISSKGDFGGGNFLDISMKKDKNSNKKYLEIYSDLTRPLLSEYKFFNGLSGGKLLFTSIIDDSKSNSKLKIENFNVINAPGLIKLLSLADLGGLADLAEGEGLSFDVLEIDLEKNKNFLKLNEILALGPSVSVLMEGYQDENGLTSLRGTLVPAKTLNKMISKIPIIGNIVIPKEVGEGLFGISFKMKGPKGKIKTTINPIRTLTPRFIQKIIDRNKETK